MKPASISHLEVRAYRVPTDGPESDGTLDWDHTGVIAVHLRSGSTVGLGWTYGARAVAALIRDVLCPVVVGADPFQGERIWQSMRDRLRNAGSRSLGAMAVAAVDIAVWDLRARLLGLPLVALWGAAREAVPIYGSGGFTNYTPLQMSRQLARWVKDGIPRVKIKVGRDSAKDPGRVAQARKAIGSSAALMVDANGGYAIKEAVSLAERFRASGVVWFEEPVSSDNLPGLRMIREHAPSGMEIAAGEYGDYPAYFLSMLQASAVDCIQADATRCGGFTGFLKIAALAEAFQLPLSAHCAPQLHAHVGCATQCLRHAEYFHDHVRVERLLFDGCLRPDKGTLRPAGDRPGHGLTLKAADADRYTA